MGDKSKIQWTDATWNPIRGCSKVSEGCRNCYAEGVAARFSGPGMPYEGIAKEGRWTGQVRMIQEHLRDPLLWKKPRRIFVNSMSDLFHESLTDDQIDKVFAVMALAEQHQFQVLTKRPDRMLTYFNDELRWPMIEGAAQGIYFERTGERPEEWLAINGPLSNVWLGVSVEDQQTADERIPLLLETPAALRFISAEPLLGPLDLKVWWLRQEYLMSNPPKPLGRPLDWVIVGGESGPGARPFDIEWCRKLAIQCTSAHVPIFIKQLGTKSFDSSAPVHVDLSTGKALDGNRLYFSSWKGGDPLEWPQWARIRQFPKGASA